MKYQAIDENGDTLVETEAESEIEAEQKIVAELSKNTMKFVRWIDGGYKIVGV